MTIEFSKTEEGKDWFTFSVDRSRLRTTGFKALDEFLHKLHVYKSIGDFETGQKFFEHYSQVDETMLRVREIVMENKVPRRLEIQPNLFAGESYTYKDYPETFEGIIESYGERFTSHDDVWALWKEKKDVIRME
jgi:dipeptidyl-peptidase-3